MSLRLALAFTFGALLGLIADGIDEQYRKTQRECDSLLRRLRITA